LKQHQTEVYFERQRAIISEHIESAKNFILVAMAWFTDKSLFEQLVNKATNGVQVQVLIHDDDINANAGIDYSSLVRKNSELILIADKDRILHYKFCVIDCYTVLHGSYNWTYQAMNNHETLTVTQGDISLAAKFITQFFKLKKSYISGNAFQHNSNPRLEHKKSVSRERKTSSLVEKIKGELDSRREKKIAISEIKIDFTEFPNDGKALYRLIGIEGQGTFEFRSDQENKLYQTHLQAGLYTAQWILYDLQHEQKFKARLESERFTTVTDWKNCTITYEPHYPKGIHKFSRSLIA
jgi:hypothetical protein